MESAESSVTVSGDLIEYSGSGIVNRSITPILSRHFTGLKCNTNCCLFQFNLNFKETNDFISTSPYKVLNFHIITNTNLI